MAKKAYDAFAAGDLETVLSTFDDNVEFVVPGNSTISGTYRGKAEVTNFFAKLAEKSFTTTPSRFLADEDVVVVLGQVTAGGESAPEADVATYRDGKNINSRPSATLPCSNGSTAQSSERRILYAVGRRRVLAVQPALVVFQASCAIFHTPH